MKNKYNLLFKTGDAEIRALEKSNINFEKIFPIIELTRGRKSKSDKIGIVSKRIEQLYKIFNDQRICIDLTTEESLSNSQIDDLYNYENGYLNWILFIKDLKLNYFNKVIPTILVNTDDKNSDKNLLTQVQELSGLCDTIAYRNNITDDGYFEDLQLISKFINNKENLKFILIFDCEYVPSGAVLNTIEVLQARIQKVRRLIPRVKTIVVSTSFPRYVSDIGNDDSDIFPLNELTIYNGLKDRNIDVLYGDYGSINPIRNDTVMMTRGWIPRIDVPTLNGIYYHRLRNKLNDYSSTYILVAQKVFNDSRFPRGYNSNWGIKQIISSKNGNAPGSAPSFWISVRMSIFIEMQLKRMGLV
jgi:hypothetical protein